MPPQVAVAKGEKNLSAAFVSIGTSASHLQLLQQLARLPGHPSVVVNL